MSYINFLRVAHLSNYCRAGDKSHKNQSSGLIIVKWMLSKENWEVENIFWSKLMSKTIYKKTQITPKFLFWQNGISLWFYLVVITLPQEKKIQTFTYMPRQ